MKNFLKRYSSVPNGFIEDFFSISKESYEDNELIIDFDIVVDWLEVRKDNLKRLMVKYFTQDYDYEIVTIKKYNENGSGSNYVEEIWITPDCFKELCMLSQTPKAKEVRQYYLSVEKLVKEYHQYIAQKMRERMTLLLQNQKPKHRIRGGKIYFFKALNHIKYSELEEDLYKIGKTIFIDGRFENYNSPMADNIEPLFELEIDDIDAVENCIKNVLTKYQYRKHGKEVYQIEAESLKHVFNSCQSFMDGMKKYLEKTSPKKSDSNIDKINQSINGPVLVFEDWFLKNGFDENE